MKHFIPFIAAAAAVFTAPADATLLDYTLIGNGSLSWQIDSDRTPDASDGNGFTFDNVSFANSNSTVQAAIEFRTLGNSGGFDITADAGHVVAYGAQLFSGLTSDPTLLTGVFSLYSGIYTLTVAPAASPSPAPEPASWAMMIGGFGVVGATMRRRKAALRFA